MFSLVMLTLTAGGELVTERAELNEAMATLKRLAAAASVPPRNELNPTRRERELAAEFGPQRSELEQLVKYIDKAQTLLGSERAGPGEVVNFHQVVWDTINCGLRMVPLVEEKLCWERAGLDLAAAYRRIVKRQVEAGVMPSQCLNQAEAQVARFEKRYRDVLARCAAK